MRLVLHRKYKATSTLGRLLLGQKQLCFTREPPKACFGTGKDCLEDGVYELEPIHSEEKGWEIGIGEKGKISSYTGDERLESCSIYPVTCYRADGTPMFTKLAFLQLMERLENEWERGKIVELQIVSEGIPYLLESCLEQSYS
ncbi:hypothetical protein SAMN04489724_0862 [Algoriphagus locisalis]|uniref:DUF5675 domain-containing protein n=1 Tax=Algoriphagus locisalis TaxID=305507 RepID=A0A1I6Y864_9BACT|nr:DUF5675 family protein [Algoriphagus locisalis]SFT46461.1 hypothetical protein SAMN04489724_0862 [Algoriphagus locisalis]